MIVQAYKASNGDTVTIRKESNGRQIAEVETNHPLELLAFGWLTNEHEKQRHALAKRYEQTAAELNDADGREKYPATVEKYFARGK